MVYEKRRESQVGTKLGAYRPELVTSLRMKSTLLKWLMRISAAIFSLLFIAFIALQSEKVQGAAARTLASTFEQQQGLTLEFDSLKIDWWSQEVALIDCRVGVPFEDTLLFNFASVNLGHWRWVNGSWELGELRLSGATLDASAVTRWVEMNATNAPTDSTRAMEGALERLIIEDLSFQFQSDSLDITGFVQRFECADIQLFHDFQHAKLTDFKGDIWSSILGKDTLRLEHCGGIWNANATTWQWSAGSVASNLVTIACEADGQWNTRSFTEAQATATIEQGADFPKYAGSFLSSQGATAQWTEWLALELEETALIGKLELGFEQHNGWTASLHHWRGIPGIKTLEFAQWDQLAAGDWVTSGRMQGLLTAGLMSLQSTPLAVNTGSWLAPLDSMLSKNDHWDLVWGSTNQTIHFACELGLNAQAEPIELELDWSPQSDAIDWRGQQLPPFLDSDRGFGNPWEASGHLDWTPHFISWNSTMRFSSGGYATANAAAQRDTTDTSTAKWKATGTVISRENPLPLDMSWDGMWSPEAWNWQSQNSLMGFQPLLLSQREDWKLYAQSALRASGDSSDSLSLVFEMRQINLLENGRPMAFNRLDVSGKWSPLVSDITWNSDLTDGQLRIENDWKRWRIWLDELKNQKAHSRKAPPELQAQCRIRSFAPIATLAHIPLSIDPGSKLTAYSKSGGAEIHLDFPKVKWGDYQATRMQFVAKESGHNVFLNAQCDAVSHEGELWLEEAHLGFSGDSLWWVDASWKSPDSDTAEIQWSVESTDENTFDLNFTQSHLPIGNQVFKIDSKQHLLVMKQVDSGVEIQCENLALASNDWTIKTEGMYRSTGESNWLLDLSGKTLPRFYAPPFSALHGEGLEAAFEWCRVNGRSEFSAFGSGQSLGYDSLDIYAIDFIVNGDLKSASYWLSAQTASETPIAANGRVPLNQNEAMRSTVFFESVPLGWLNTWMPPQSVTWSGEVSGELAIDGTPSLPLIEGFIASDSAKVFVDYLGSTYRLKGECSVKPDEFFLDQWEAQDSEGHTARINGTVMHEHFKQWNFDVGLEAEKPFQLLNLSREDNDWFYGSAYATGDVNVFGFDNNLQIEARLKTGPGTRFALPLDGASDASYASFIHFNQPLTASDDVQKVTPDLSRFRVDLNVEVTEDAVARIIFDESVGDEIMGVTTGDLAIAINDFEQITMNGQLEVVEGAYFFTLQNLINKQFDIEPGGTISWFGDPYEAEIDLNTRYAIRSSLDGLLPNEANLPGRIPIHLNLELQGALMRPDIGFSIDLPEASPQLVSLVEGALINEDELNRQALSLLVLNQFLSPDPISSGIGGENMQDKSAAFIASQLGHWISQISPDMDIGFDYANDPTRGEQALAVALSTRLLDDRLHVEGAIGTNQLSQVSTQNVQLQDMTLSYDLDQNGHFQVTGHTRQNPEWSSPDGATTQGVGLRFQREFNTWGERRKKREANLKEEL